MPEDAIDICLLGRVCDYIVAQTNSINAAPNPVLPRTTPYEAFLQPIVESAYRLRLPIVR